MCETFNEGLTIYQEVDFSLEEKDSYGKTFSLDDNVLLALIDEKSSTTIQELKEKFSLSKLTVSMQSGRRKCLKLGILMH